MCTYVCRIGLVHNLKMEFWWEENLVKRISKPYYIDEKQQGYCVELQICTYSKVRCVSCSLSLTEHINPFIISKLMKVCSLNSVSVRLQLYCEIMKL